MAKAPIAIHVLADGRVVFGDLTPELADVAAILAGGRAPDSRQDGANSAIVSDPAGAAGVEVGGASARCGEGERQSRPVAPDADGEGEA